MESTLNSIITAAFEKLKAEGKNTVEGLLQWLKSKKLLATEAAETHARELLSAGATEGKVQLDQFKQVVQKTAEESKVGADQVLDMVRDHGNSFVGTVAGSAKKLGNLLLKDKKE
ncbi:hypothetical protein JYU34_005064 [Plutella xylostella]|uniref:Uncharacterized protein n=1 Tax=Plutella xylostella TaxID=51655 RepID=A0ABQ7QVR4_PLUXY|nr:hypothetical protein JYU34_005064 [Plutella xylostella]